jgi:hypothetical protein
MMRIWAVIAVVALIAPGLASADYYRYETENGTTAFTDDEKRIPTRYRGDVVQVKEERFQDYARLSIVSRDVQGPVAAVPNPVVDGVTEVPVETAGDLGDRIQISTNPSTTTLEVPAGTATPAHVERYTEWRWIDGLYVPHAVVKHDGRVVSIVRLR